MLSQRNKEIVKMELEVDYIFGEQEHNECRVCLATDSKLYHLLLSGLSNDFYNITGIQISPNDGLSQFICYICRKILRKAVAFRNKSISTQNILSQQSVTINCGQNIVIKPLIPLAQTDVLLISIPQVEATNETHTSNLISETLVKEEKIQISEQEDKFSESKNVKAEVDEIFVEDLLEPDLEVTSNNESEKLEVAKEVNTIQEKPKLKAKIKSKAKKAVKTKEGFPEENKGDLEMDIQGVKEYLLSTSTANVYAQMLYSYLINKYIDNCEEFNVNKADDDNELIDFDDELDSNKSIKVEEDTAQIDEILSSNQTGPSKKILFEFVKERYMQNKKLARKRRTRDLVTTKFKKDLKVVKSQEAVDELRKQYNMDIKRLSLEEQITEIKDRATLQGYKNSSYKCEECFRGFQYERTYNDHMKLHDPAVSGNFKCEVCNKRFINRRKLLKHQLNHKYRIICKECGRVFKDHHIARQHAKTHSGQNKYKCEYCCKVFSKYKTRVTHVRAKHGNVQCEICYELMAPSGLKMHIGLRHKETFKCQYCDKAFNDSDALDTHTRYSGNGGGCNANERPCARCGENFSSESQWISHVEEHRKNTKRTSRKKCNPANRGESLQKAEPGKRRRLTMEEKALEPARYVMCEMCGDMFHSQAAMRYHQRIHTGEKPFACTFCPKRFRLKSYLLMHINTHTGERPHKCQKCQSSFKSARALYQHQMVHTKERRHRCTLCEKTFKTSTCVNVHIRTVHSKKPTPPRVRNRKKRTELLEKME